MFTREQYLNGTCSHREYYGQFVTESTKQAVKAIITLDRIRRSKDSDFNDISLNRWDRCGLFINNCALRNGLRECGDYPTLGGLVCIAKEAAEQLRE